MCRPAGRRSCSDRSSCAASRWPTRRDCCCGRTATSARRGAARARGGQGITAAARAGERAGDRLRWQRYRGRKAGEPELSVELAVAKEGADAHVAALIARRAELERLVRTALLPALDSFVSGPPDPPGSVLAVAPRDPSYWPTTGWRTASPASQGMDGERLDEMIAEIRAREAADRQRDRHPPRQRRARLEVRTVRRGQTRRAVRGRTPARAAVGDEVGQLDAARDRHAASAARTASTRRRGCCDSPPRSTTPAPSTRMRASER